MESYETGKKGVFIVESLTLRCYVGTDGILNLQIPVEMKDAYLEVGVTMRPIEASELGMQATANGWPPGFFESTFGCLRDFPEREAQGDYEVREEF